VIAAHPDPRQPGGRYDTLLGGLHTTPAMISHPGRQSGIQVALHPLGARALLGRPAGEVAALDVELTAVLGPVALLLRERLLACAGWDERFAVLDDVLLRRARAANGADGPASGGVPREAARAWQVLAATGGRTGVADLAGGVGWSQRRLLQVFRREVGLTPKEAGRVVRFHRARRLLFGAAGAGQPVSLAGLAARAGYYDQAHLAREFRALAGCSPSVLLAEEFRFVQATPADDDAGW
jgi:AraC-like DNA-binding protein